MSVYYKVSSAWVPVSVPFYRAGGLSTQPKSVYYKVSGTWTKIYPLTGYHVIAAGTMTKDSASSGTTTVTVVRGGTTGGGTFSALGTYVQDLSTDVFGLRATSSSGVITNARRTFIDTNGLQLSGASAVKASIDGANWYEFQWKLDVEPSSWGTNYTWANADGLSGDPFGLYAMSDGAVKKVLIAVAD